MAGKYIYSHDSLGRKILQSSAGKLTLRPSYEFWTDEPLVVPDDCRIHFQHWIFEGKSKTSTNTTTRSLDRYLPAAYEAAMGLGPHQKLVEVGAGLGELVPAMANRFARTHASFVTPTVIDPLNYHALLEMISEMQRMIISEEEYGILQRVKDHAEVIINPKKVTLINTTLGKALKNYGFIKGGADLVVDNWGAVAYTDTEFHRCECVFGRTFRVKCMETDLLKPNGQHFMKGIDAEMLLHHRRNIIRR